MNNPILLIVLSALFLSFGCGNTSDDLEYTGTVEGTSVKVPAMTPGKILNIGVKTGDLVQKEQYLAAIDSLDLTYQRDQLLATLEELVAQTEIAKSNLHRATDDYNYLKTKYDRIETLYHSQSITRQQLDDINNSLQNAGIAVSNSRQSLSTIAAKIKQVEAKLKSINKRIGDTFITSPIDGFITDIFYEEGEAVPQFGPILEIINIKRTEVKIYISQELLSQIKYGQEVKVKADGREGTITGKIIWISPKAEFTPKTILTPSTRSSLVYAVKILIPNDESILKHGMPVVITL